MIRVEVGELLVFEGGRVDVAVVDEESSGTEDVVIVGLGGTLLEL